MRKTIIILFLCLIFGSVYSQTSSREITQTYGESITFTIAGTDSGTKTVYVCFPSFFGPGASERVRIDTSALSRNPYITAGNGNAYLNIVLEDLTTHSNDSLQAWIKPYSYNGAKGAWYDSYKDSTFLVMDTQGTYAQATVDYLTWVDDKMYDVPLSNELWACGGFTLTFRQKIYGTHSTRVYLTIYFTY